MRIFNTKTRSPEEIQRDIGFYCCGPTVYGPAHIGNFRTFVVQDVFRRVVEAEGYKCYHVRNITDVDDKTIRDSQAAGQSLADFTNHWTKKFHADCKALNLLQPDVEPGAVEHIPEQIQLIQDLISNGSAYKTEDGSVYFKISSFSDYGKLASLNIDTKNLQASEDSDEYDKDNVADFALWKSRKPEDGDNFWDSPFGQGRPGWHTECSAMSLKYCSDKLDVHSGGIDLLFPHHENETAQAQCATGKDFFKVWFHVEHLLVDGKKMSKSLGNLYTLQDLEAKGYSARELRLALLQGHYRKQLNFTFEGLHSARKSLARIDEAISRVEQREGKDFESIEADGTPEAFSSMVDDLNTPQTLGKLIPALGKIEGPELKKVLYCFGIGKEVVSIPEAVTALAEERLKARQNKDWAESDRLRDEIVKLGYQIKDGKDGYKVTKS